ncbi:MAG: site-2 protease family protein, partial [Aeoliella sp.]
GSRELGMCLIAATEAAATAIDWAGYGHVALAILMTAIGLGFIIFVHELGHFAVAKWCGVKCDKFMIGFDIAGYKIGRQWGETYYGIGILPLGGYVKMMGQDDDPRMTAEQIAESKATGDTVDTRQIVGPSGEKIDVDARSYLAKTVPQRMAIISAGVIMNVIFAFIFAVFAFRIGVPSEPCIVSSTDPGAPAWQHGLLPDDKIVRIGDIDEPWYMDLRNEVSLSGRDEEVEFEVVQAKTGETTTINIRPSRERLKLAQIGVMQPVSLTLVKKGAARPFSPSAAVKDKIPDGGRIVAVDGTPVETYGQLAAILAANPESALSYTFEPKADKEGVVGESSTVTIGHNHSEYVGLVMRLGPITAIQKDSPAEQAGLKIGDQIVAVNNVPIGMASDDGVGWDPRTLSERLAKIGRDGQSVALEIKRPATKEGEKPTELTIAVTPRKVTWFEIPFTAKSPASAPALGIAYALKNEVVGTVPGSPARKVDLQPGDKIVSAQLEVSKEHEDDYKSWKKPIDFEEFPDAWAYVVSELQGSPPDSVLKLKVAREGTKKPLEVAVDVDVDTSSFDPRRGLGLTPILETRKGDSFGEQCSMAWYETKRSLTSVYRFLGRIINNDIPATALGGPITIANAAYSWAMSGVGKLLLFLTLISANLAVVNFLPIPLLDGGHMVFLIYEGIFGRPANEKFVMVMHLAGFALIIGLMLFVFGLDLGLIDRNL